ncbi:hypothetical protein V494_08182 [Pseudogymnoascus sp. VKM F-4513 (FW-928)]|nr:hypothetical protein V494_08182 [Pseudogymnoascus sp. VKM F-4513 (FW-928)]
MRLDFKTLLLLAVASLPVASSPLAARAELPCVTMTVQNRRVWLPGVPAKDSVLGWIFDHGQWVCVMGETLRSQPGKDGHFWFTCLEGYAAFIDSQVVIHEFYKEGFAYSTGGIDYRFDTARSRDTEGADRTITWTAGFFC